MNASPAVALVTGANVHGLDFDDGHTHGSAHPAGAIFPAVLAVAEHLDTVNLPADRKSIEGLLDRSERSFTGESAVVDREFLFVLEDLAAKRIIGTSMIYAQHGTKRAPHIFFRVENDERYSVTLDKHMIHQTLRIGYNYNGPTEIGGLILLPEYRRNVDALGKSLSYVRFLFMRMHRPLFRAQVLSELLPPLEPDGTSKLWEALGRKFTGLTYQEADLLSKDNKEFIHALFPDDPIHLELLPDDVQKLIGQVGPETRAGPSRRPTRQSRAPRRLSASPRWE